MLLIVYTTGQCNLRCRYCGGSFPPNVVPWRIEYPVKLLVDFVSRVDNPIICFYGGEPLLNPRFIEKVMDEIEDAKYVIQTNGLLVDALRREYWARFDTVLLSIDGREEVTDYYRGRGVYRAVLRATHKLREYGFKGDLVARMVVSEKSDVFKEVYHLYSLKVFDHIHWQLDVVWSDRWKDFDKWVRESYKPGLEKLVNWWINMVKGGTVPGIAPFQALTYSMLTGKNLPSPPCESGVNSFTILPDGRIIACPIAVYEKWAEVGQLGVDSPKTVKRVEIEEPCISCPYFKLCGGRCLYAYKERLWGEEGFRKICNLTIYLINLLKQRLNEVREALNNGLIELEDLNYPKYNNSVEIIP